MQQDDAHCYYFAIASCHYLLEAFRHEALQVRGLQGSSALWARPAVAQGMRAC